MHDDTDEREIGSEGADTIAAQGAATRSFGDASDDDLSGSEGRDTLAAATAMAR